MSIIRIQDQEVKPGQKVLTKFVVTQSTLYEVALPLYILNGKEPGPVICLVSGIHGDEYEGSEAIRKIFRDLEPAQVRGSIVGLPVVNPPAYAGVSRTSPVDNLNMNRVFPGNPDGSLTERIAHLVTEQILPVANYVIDLHSGGAALDLYPLVFFRVNDERSLQLAKSFGFDALVDSPPVKGTFADTSCDKGIPTITLEIGGSAVCNKGYVNEYIKRTYNVLQSLNIVKGVPSGLPDEYTIYSGWWMKANTGGFLRPQVALRDEVFKGDVLGYIIDVMQENTREEIRAPYDAKILGVRTIPITVPGDWTFLCCRVRDVIKKGG
jgi:predicted deacylase